MDSDVDGEFPFAASFPLPFRVLFLAGMGILGWATNLHGMDLLGVDAPTAMELRATDGNRAWSPLPSHQGEGGFNFGHSSQFYKPIYQLFFAYSAWCLAAWFLFRYVTNGQLELIDAFRYIASICSLGVLIVLVSPFNVFQKRERDLFLLSIWRCFFSPIDRSIYFSDVVFADVFTSFAKVLGDVWLSTLMLFPGRSILSLPSQDGWLKWILPSIMSLPYLIRLRQCLIEHSLPANNTRRHIYNAIKYATSFPVIYLSVAQKIVISELVGEKGEQVREETWHGDHLLFRLWLFAAAVNSLYSFWWDMTNDWGFELLKPTPTPARDRRSIPPKSLVLPSLHSKSESITAATLHSLHSAPEASHSAQSTSTTPKAIYPYGLRPTLLYPLPVYPLIIFLNFILRMTWSIKLSSHLHSHTDGGEVIFWLEMAEVVRRWMWVFIRVEWEVVKRAQEGSAIRLEDDEEIYELLQADPDRDGEDLIG